MNQLDLLNEETLKNEIILPALKNITVCDKFYYETNFKLITTANQEKNITGKIKNIFSDILIYGEISGEMIPILLIEVKRANHIINTMDIDQGACYARLCENIVPFFMVTNSKKTMIFDTLTKEEVNRIDNSKLSPSIDEEIRNYAMQVFIGLSEVNLLEFCEEMSKKDFYDEMNINSNFINENLIIDRKNYLSLINDFFNCDKRVFGMLGFSGVGKTNLMYSIWKKYQDKYPIIFINAIAINGKLEDSIRNRFNFLMKREYSFNEYLNKLDSLSRQTLIIMIDGIDEYISVNSLKNEIKEILKITNNIKFIISSKIPNNSILKLDSQNKNYDEYIDIMSTNWGRIVSDGKGLNIIGNEVFMEKNGYSLMIKELDTEELIEFRNCYFSHYNINSNLLNYKFVEDISNPFFLRIFCEVVSANGRCIDFDEINIKKIYDKWFKSKLSQLSEYIDISIYSLGILAHSIILANEGISKHEILDNSRLSNKWNLIQELLNIGILNITVDEYGKEYINFAYDDILYYSYLFYYLDMDKIRILELKESLNDMLSDMNINAIPIIIFYISCMTNHEQLFLINSSDGSHDCSVCKKKIEKGEKMTLIWQFYLSKIKGNRGFFEFSHIKCQEKGNSILRLYSDGNEEISTMSKKDIFDFYRIAEMLPKLAKESERRYNGYVSQLKGRAVIKQFYENGTFDFISATIGEEKKVILIFKNKTTASKYKEIYYSNYCKGKLSYDEYREMFKSIIIDNDIMIDMIKYGGAIAFYNVELKKLSEVAKLK